MKKKSLIQEIVEQSQRCECLHPNLIDTISVGKYGYHSFCKNCSRERRITQQELDEMIRIKKVTNG